jgi:carbamoyl-phosphate synthase large subunit
LADRHKPAGLVLARRLRDLGLRIAATQGTADHLAQFGLPVDLVVAKVSRDDDVAGDTAVDLIARGEITFVINTPQGRGGRSDGEAIRKAANVNHVSLVTTIDAALAAVQGMAEQHKDPSRISVRALQDYHGR